MTTGVRPAALLRAIATELAAAGVPSPAADARHILTAVLGRDVWTGTAVDPAAVRRIGTLVAARTARVPLQLLLGETTFRRVPIQCRPGVFIPRPETEVVVEHALHAVRETAHRPVRVAEPCTGSGAITCALLDEAGDRVHVVATDTDPAAVALATANLARLGRVPARVRRGHLLDPLPTRWRGVVDVVVANPPYLTPEELAGCDPEVRDHDPATALVAGPSGLEVTAALFTQARRWCRPGGWVVVEISPLRVDAAVRAAADAGLEDVRTFPDLVGRPRVLVARVPR